MNLLQIIRGLSAAALLGALTLTVNAATTAVEDRVKPVGEVCMAGQPCASATTAAAAGGAPRSGEQVYTTGCAACHGTGAAGAPKVGDTAAWKTRMEKGKETLYKNAFEGFNAMPAKGLCSNCTQEEVNAAVDHMLTGSGI